MAEASQEFNVGPRDIPGRNERWREDEYEHRIHAPGGGVTISTPIVMGGGAGGGKRGRRRRDGECEQLPVPPPATLPLTGAELFEMFQASANFPFWRRVSTNVLDFIRQYFPAAFSWKALNARADTPPVTLCTTPNIDMVWEITYSVACKTQDAGASTGTMTITFSSLDGTVSPVTHTCNLAVVGDGRTEAITVLLSPGSSITVAFAGGGTYGLASYDLLITATPKSSSQAINNPNNAFFS